MKGRGEKSEKGKVNWRNGETGKLLRMKDKDKLKVKSEKLNLTPQYEEARRLNRRNGVSGKSRRAKRDEGRVKGRNGASVKRSKNGFACELNALNEVTNY